MIGDAGKPQISPREPVFQLLDQKLQALKNPDRASLIFLGDNIYPKGLPDPANQEKRQEAEKYLIEQLKIIKNFSGRSFIIPGNHDWAQGRKQGWQNAQNQEAFINEFLDNDQVFQPTDACAGPVEIALSPDLTLILINSQWWFHQWDKPGIESDCEAKGDMDFLLLLKDAIERNKDKKVIIAAHHPLISNGSHGGYFPPSTHLFPFGVKKKPIPLPILGSIYVGFRKYIGSVQDIPNVRYRQLRNYLFKLFKEHPHLTYVAGHDHNLQHHPQDNWHHIVSGSGSKITYIAKKKKADFAYAQKGFARLDYYDSG
ncbi:MAG: metallophosphoesterase, partial [Bacteroidota bacterium]